MVLWLHPQSSLMTKPDPYSRLTLELTFYDLVFKNWQPKKGQSCKTIRGLYLG